MGGRAEAARLLRELASLPGTGSGRWRSWFHDETGAWTVRDQVPGGPTIAIGVVPGIAGYLAAIPPPVLHALADALAGETGDLAGLSDAEGLDLVARTFLEGIAQ